MSGNEQGDAVWYLLILILPLSALIARRLPLAQVAKMALAWVGIFAAMLIMVTLAMRGGLTPENIGDALGLSGETVRGGRVVIAKSADGHFWTTVRIGSVQRRMLIDSGATVTSISESTAKAAGIDPTADKYGTIIDTANGPAIVRRATAPDLRVGGIEAHGLDIQVGRNFDDAEVIGMNFLSRLKSWRVEGDSMILEAKQ